MNILQFIVFFLIFFPMGDVKGLLPRDASQTAASLLCYVDGLSDDCEHYDPSNHIAFTKEDVNNLWNRIFEELLHSPHFDDLLEAYQALALAEEEMKSENIATAKTSLSLCSFHLTFLWLQLNDAAEEEISTAILVQPEHAENPLLTGGAEHLNPPSYLSTEMLDEMGPFLIPDDHPMKSPLDTIFTASRATQDEQALKQAGFKILFHQPRSFIRVVKHSKLSGYLLKLYTDDEQRKKGNQPGWLWLTRRCRGAHKIQQIIENTHIKNFQVPEKRLYLLPPEPSPPSLPAYTRHPAVLLVKNMHLLKKKQNLEAWNTLITSEHLDELYFIISKGNGGSYRADNISYSKNGKFSFIDTEYPHRKPDFKSIRRYLSKSMCSYWDKLVRQGGS
jgi:hypothetical protein